ERRQRSVVEIAEERAAARRAHRDVPVRAIAPDPGVVRRRIMLHRIGPARGQWTVPGSALLVVAPLQTLSLDLGIDARNRERVRRWRVVVGDPPVVAGR